MSLTHLSNLRLLDHSDITSELWIEDGYFIEPPTDALRSDTEIEHRDMDNALILPGLIDVAPSICKAEASQQVIDDARAGRAVVAHHAADRVEARIGPAALFEHADIVAEPGEPEQPLQRP